MKKNFKQKLIGFALSVFAISAFAQCPGVITNFNITYGANGTASISPVISASVNATQTMYYWNTSQGVSQTSGLMSQQGTFQFPANGTYSICLTYNDSAAMCTSNQYCSVVNITNSTATNCQAGFTYYTDSSCVTHFVNSSIGNNLTYQWYTNAGLMDTMANTSAALPNGWSYITLYSLSGGVFCDSVSANIHINCGGNPTGCNASFAEYTDSSCVTHFTNYSTGTNLTYQWVDFSNNNVVSTQQNPSLTLSSGPHYIGLFTYSNGLFCDSIMQYVVNNCNGNPVSCNASFWYYTDSVNCTTHFNNTSTGTNLTYQWYDIANGFTLLSTQQNPTLNLPQGNHFLGLYTYSNGQFCDSMTASVNVSCVNNPGSCNASFSYYTDSMNCTTYFNNTSTGTNLSYIWNIGGANYTTANPSIPLTNGYTPVSLQIYSNGQFCDSAFVYANISCPSAPDTTVNNCMANSYFTLFGDSINPGNFFAYNMSSGTGNVSYVWDFGDGTASTQQYPFHQYAVPGQYVLCLTVSATNGTTTCTDTYCDSSSVQKMASGFLMSQIAVIPQNVTGIKNETLVKGLNVFPNPMQDELTIEMILSENTPGLTCSLVDALGKVVLEKNITDSKTIINTADLDKGFYFLSITEKNSKTIKTIKLIK